jgi:hypothetical protein
LPCSRTGRFLKLIDKLINKLIRPSLDRGRYRRRGAHTRRVHPTDALASDGPALESVDMRAMPATRVATLVLVTGDGVVAGVLPPFEVETPWWQEVEPVVRGARERHGVDVTVLRILESELPRPPGGAVTYLAEVAAPVPAAPWGGALDDHPLRLPWARPGGPARDLAWAGSILAERGMRRTGPAQQIRSWNLSSIWRLPVDGQTVWFKAVPPFLGHEGRMLERLQGGPVPPLLAHDGGRMLLAEVPGEDLYDASGPVLLDMVTLLVDLQRAWIDRCDELLALGLPDSRAPSLCRAIASVVERTAGELTTAERAALAGFVAGLDERLAAVAACGVPDTLVHGDFYPGNLRGGASALVLLDWGDCSVGHPLLDESAFLGRIAREEAPAVAAHWHRAWRAVAPGSDPDRASLLLEPVAAARGAAGYRAFVDGIEPSEHPYHRDDPAACLRRTAALVAAERR